MESMKIATFRDCRTIFNVHLGECRMNEPRPTNKKMVAFEISPRPFALVKMTHKKTDLFAINDGQNLSFLEMCEMLNQVLHDGLDKNALRDLFINIRIFRIKK